MTSCWASHAASGEQLCFSVWVMSEKGCVVNGALITLVMKFIDQSFRIPMRCVFALNNLTVGSGKSVL